MSDPLAETLSKFTPDGSGLDREALLFAAGEASARPNRRWMALSGALAALQLVTLSILWQRSHEASALPIFVPIPVVLPGPASSDEPVPSPKLDGPSLLTTRDRAFATEGNLPSPGAIEPMTPTHPPLRAFASPPSLLLE